MPARGARFVGVFFVVLGFGWLVFVCFCCFLCWFVFFLVLFLLVLMFYFWPYYLAPCFSPHFFKGS